jgi:salicylate 5-hydroxylase small subunit
MTSFEHYLELQQLYADYAAALDEALYERWPDFFVEDGTYRLQSKENVSLGHPLATIWCESRGMMQDRVYAVRETLYHEAYFQRHVVSAPRIVGQQDGVLHSEASYVVLRTKRGQFPEILSVGKYVDSTRKVDGKRLFVTRQCIFDNELIPNSIIYPI